MAEVSTHGSSEHESEVYRIECLECAWGRSGADILDVDNAGGLHEVETGHLITYREEGGVVHSDQ